MQYLYQKNYFHLKYQKVMWIFCLGINKNIYKNQNKNFDDKYENRKQDLEKIKSIIKQIKNFDKNYNVINNYRNDVNHCWMRETSMDIKKIKEKINKFKKIFP